MAMARMLRITFIAVLMACAASSAPSQEASPTSLFRDVLARTTRWFQQVVPPSVLNDWAPGLFGLDTEHDEGMGQTMGGTERQAHAMLRHAEMLGLSSFERAFANKDAQDYPYFGFIPKYIATVRPASTTALALGESRCWKNTTATLETTAAGWELKVSVSGGKGGITPFACADYYFVGTVAEWHLAWFPTPVPGTKHYRFGKKKLSDAEVWDIQNKGVRIFRFRSDLHTTVGELVKTVRHV